MCVCFGISSLTSATKFILIFFFPYSHTKINLWKGDGVEDWKIKWAQVWCLLYWEENIATWVISFKKMIKVLFFLLLSFYVVFFCTWFHNGMRTMIISFASWLIVLSGSLGTSTSTSTQITWSFFLPLILIDTIPNYYQDDSWLKKKVEDGRKTGRKKLTVNFK